MNYLMIYVVPWPRSQGSWEAFTTKPATWDSDREVLVTLIGRFCDAKQQAKWPEHPLFGKLRQRLGRAFVQALNTTLANSECDQRRTACCSELRELQLRGTKKNEVSRRVRNRPLMPKIAI